MPELPEPNSQPPISQSELNRRYIILTRVIGRIVGRLSWKTIHLDGAIEEIQGCYPSISSHAQETRAVLEQVENREKNPQDALEEIAQWFDPAPLPALQERR